MKVGVEGLPQFNGQGEGLASPHDQLLHGDLTGVVLSVVGPAVEVHLAEHWKKSNNAHKFSPETSVH